ncbi:MAG: quinol monooxygenase YgiN [Woeseiaceae bacterium]|jgi:quinol monooxygenase YgiN
MNDSVFWMLDLQVVEGQEAALHSLMAEMVKATQANEPGTLVYEWNLSEDGTVCHLFERYSDSEALMIHLGSFGEKFAERFLAVLNPIRFFVYGSPSDAVKDALAGFNPVYMQSLAGFAR